MKLSNEEVRTIIRLLVNEWSRLDWMSKEPEIDPASHKNLIEKAEKMNETLNKFKELNQKKNPTP